MTDRPRRAVGRGYAPQVMFYAPGETEPLPIHGTAEAQPHFFHDQDTVLWGMKKTLYVQHQHLGGCRVASEGLSGVGLGRRDVVESGERWNREGNPDTGGFTGTRTDL